MSLLWKDFMVKNERINDNVKNDYGVLVAQYSLKSVLYDTMYR